jgi:pimeloyl-ACP methyl ester carboxylesterase
LKSSANTPADVRWSDGPAWFHAALAAPYRDGHVEVDSARLYYRAWGMERVELPVILLIHGFAAHTGWWHFVAPLLTTRHRVVALDLSGMGDSDHRSSYAQSWAASDIIGAVEALRLGSVVGIGHSAGGMRLLMAAARRPDLFQRLIALDTYIVFAGNRLPHPEGPQSVTGSRLYPDLATILSRYRLLPAQLHSRSWARHYIARQSVKPVEGGWRWKFDASLPAGADLEPDGSDLLPSVDVPVHYVWAENSVLVPAELARRIVSLLPRGHGPIGMPGTHHHMMFDQPEALIATLRALIA